MVVYPMTHRVVRKIFLDVINPRSREVSLWEKNHTWVRKIGVPAPLSFCDRYVQTINDRKSIAVTNLSAEG